MTEELPIPVPQRLPRHLHPLIAATRRAAEGARSGPDGRVVIGRQKGVFHLQLSRSLIPRALRIAQAVLAEATRRGYEAVTVERESYDRPAGIGLALQGQTYALQISEVMDRVPLTAEEIEQWRRDNENRFRWRLSDEEPEPPKSKAVASGRLALSIQRGYGDSRGRRSNWREGSRGPLEAKLASFFTELEERARVDAEMAERRRRAQAEREREYERERERQRLARIDEARSERLFGEAVAWRQAELARAYLAALRGRLDALDCKERKRITAWAEWGESYVERYDPVQNTRRIYGFNDEEDCSNLIGRKRAIG